MKTRRPEHWAAEAGARDVVRLDIPADALHDRIFEIFIRLAVRTTRRDATHAMRVLVDGALEWSRSVPTQIGEDSLDLRLRRTVAAGRPLRLTASCELRGAVRVSLAISADEE